MKSSQGNAGSTVQEDLDIRPKQEKELDQRDLEEFPVIVKNSDRLIVSYQSDRRVLWEVFMAVLSVYLCISIPVFLSFDQPSLTSPVTISVHVLITLIFIADVLVSARTSYLSSTAMDEVRSSKQILKHYTLSLRFILDLLSLIPFELISPAQLSLFRLLKIHKLYNLFNLVLLLRARKKVKLFLEIFLTVLFLLLYIHLIACLFYMIVNSDSSWIAPEDYSYINTVPPFLYTSYWVYLYHSVCFVALIQNGGNSETQLIYFSIFYIISIILISILLGNFTCLIRTLKDEENLYEETHTTLVAAMKKLKLPASIRYKIVEFFTVNYNNLRLNSEYPNFVSIFPPSLARKINTSYLSAVIEKNSIISSNKKVLKFALLRLNSYLIQPGVRVLSQFDEHSNLYFIANGICNVEVMDEEKNSHLVNVLKEGEHFGEISMLFKTECTATVSSLSYTSLAYLNSESFNEFLDVFPQISEKIMARVNSYKDRWSTFCKSMLKKIPYLRTSEPFLLSRILYSLTQERYESGEIIVHQGEEINYVYFLAEGELEFFTYVFDKTASFVVNSADKEEWHEDDSKILIPLGSVFTGSVLFYRISVSSSIAMTSVRAVTGVHLFKMPIGLIEKLARDRPSLFEALSQFKAGIFKYDSVRAEQMPVKYPIDAIRDEKHASGINGNYWTGLLKLRNAALRIIDVKRKSKIVNPGSIKRMVRKLKAMNHAQSIGRVDLVRLIANDQVSEDIVKVVDLLDDDEMNNHLLKQFALKANETTVVCQFLANRVKSCRKKIRKLKTDYQEIEDLSSLVEKAIMETIRITLK